MADTRPYAGVNRLKRSWTRSATSARRFVHDFGRWTGPETSCLVYASRKGWAKSTERAIFIALSHTSFKDITGN